MSSAICDLELFFVSSMWSWPSIRVGEEGKVAHVGTCAPHALMFAVVGSGDLRGRRGRYKTNLLDILRKDLNAHQLSLKTHNDILQLRDTASDRLSLNQL